MAILITTTASLILGGSRGCSRACLRSLRHVVDALAIDFDYASRPVSLSATPFRSRRDGSGTSERYSRMLL